MYILCDMDFYFKNKLYKSIKIDHFNKYSIIRQEDHDRLKFGSIFKKMKETKIFKKNLLNI